MAKESHAARVEMAGSVWRSLYRVGAWSALIPALLLRRNLGPELVGLRGFSLVDVPAAPPESAVE